MHYVEERPWWLIQRPKKERKAKAKAKGLEEREIRRMKEY